MNKFFAVPLMLIFILSLTSCNSNGYNIYFTADDEFMSEIEIYNSLHENIISSEFNDSLEKYMYSYEKKEVGFSWSELKSLTISDLGKWKLTGEEAKEDTIILQKCFKYLYPGYQYYGGDKIFDEAFFGIIEKIDTSDVIELGQLLNLYREYLNFVKDGHIYFNNQPLNKSTAVYFSEEYFYKDDKGFFEITDGEVKYINIINDEADFHELIKRTIDKDGKLAYCISINGDMDKKVTVKIKYENNDQKEITLKYHVPKQAEGSSCTVDSSGGITKVCVTSFDESRMNQNSRDNFLRSADIMAGSNISILDLRGNMGGHYITLKQWMANYDNELTDTVYGKKELFLDSIALRCFTCYSDMQERTNWFIEQKLWIEKNISINKWHINSHKYPKEMTGNNGLLFILIDKETASVSERLVLSLLNKRNVIIVGTPSAGRIHGDYGNFPIYLKNSGLELRLPNSMTFFYNDNMGREGEGVIPDIWCYGDSLEAVNNLISYYNIK